MLFDLSGLSLQILKCQLFGFDFFDKLFVCLHAGACLSSCCILYSFVDEAGLKLV
jgi:hypothetical protein